MFTSDAAHRIEAQRTITAAPSMRPARWVRPASCWWSAACRNIRGRAVRPRRISRVRGRRSTTPSRRCWRMRGRVSMPLAIEPLHPAYAADRACVNTTKTGAGHLRQARSATQWRAWRRARRLSHLVGPGIGAADRARRQRSAVGLSRLRLAGADQGHPQRSRHDGRWRHRHQGGAVGRSRRRALPAIPRSRSFPTTGGEGRWTRCCRPASSGTVRWFRARSGKVGTDFPKRSCANKK